MKVTVWGINYAPELTGIAPFNVALCSFLRLQGHEVRMVTSFPYYPAWKKLPQDRRCLFRTDRINGVHVFRCWHFVPFRPTTISRIAHEASFVISSFIRLLLLPRPDAYVVVSPPLPLGLAAWFLSRLKPAPFVFHVQDLQPEAAVGLGMLKSGPLVSVLYWLESQAYRRAARVSGISRGMLGAFRQKGVPVEKTVYFPNGISLPGLEEISERGGFRTQHGFSPSDVIAVYSGNLGVKQGLEVLIEAARLLTDPRIRILICGEGARREALIERVRALGLTNTRFMPLQPEPEYRAMLVDADLAIIPQQRGSGAAFFPSKLLPTLAFGKPVLAVADKNSELVRAVDEGDFGWHVEPDRPAEIAKALEQCAANPLLLSHKGKAGRRFVEQFELNRVLSRFHEHLGELRDAK